MPINPLIESLAQTQFKYSKLFEDQAAILRKDPVVYQNAYDSVANSEGIAKEGQRWMPKPDEKEAYMKHLEDICAMDPKSPHDRMKICFAAYAFLACLTLLDIGKLPTKDQLKVNERFAELLTAELAYLSAPAFIPPPLRPEPDLPALQIYIPINTQMHQVTEKEMQAFLKNPLELFGKRFMLKHEGQDDLHYEVVKFETSKEKGHYYGVQYADCFSAVGMDADELRTHLQESYILDATPTVVNSEDLDRPS